jgi:hypothetical protein
MAISRLPFRRAGIWLTTGRFAWRLVEMLLILEYRSNPDPPRVSERRFLTHDQQPPRHMPMQSQLPINAVLMIRRRLLFDRWPHLLRLLPLPPPSLFLLLTSRPVLWV